MKPMDSEDGGGTRTAFWYPPFVVLLSAALLALLIHDPVRPTKASIPGTYVTGTDGFSLDMFEGGEARLRSHGYLPEARYRYRDGQVVVEARSQMGDRVTWVFEVEHQALVSEGFRLNRRTD